MIRTPERQTFAATAAPPTCPRCGGVVAVGDRTCPACGARLQAAAAPGTVSPVVGFLLFLPWLGIFLIWIWPGFLARVGMAPLAHWLDAVPARRFILFVPMVAFSIAAATLQRGVARGRTRSAWAPLASAPGARMVEGASTLDHGEIVGGLEVRTQVRSWLLTLDTVSDGSSPATRLRAKVVPLRPLTLLVCPQNRLFRAFTSPAVGGFLLKLGRAGPAETGEREVVRQHALDQLGFMVGAEIPLGDPEFDHALMLKGSDEDAVKRLAAGMRAPLLALAPSRNFWSVTLASDPTLGVGGLEFRESGVVRDAARLGAARDQLAGLLERLAADGVIAERPPAPEA